MTNYPASLTAAEERAGVTARARDLRDTIFRNCRQIADEQDDSAEAIAAVCAEYNNSWKRAYGLYPKKHGAPVFQCLTLAYLLERTETDCECQCSACVTGYHDGCEGDSDGDTCSDLSEGNTLRVPVEYLRDTPDSHGGPGVSHTSTLAVTYWRSAWELQLTTIITSLTKGPRP